MSRLTHIDDQGKAGPVVTCDLRVDLTPPQVLTITPVELQAVVD